MRAARRYARVVVYDGAGLFSAARAWWMFKAFGHAKVAVLDGGMPSWEREGGDVDDAPVDHEAVAAGAAAAAAPPASTSYKATLDPRLVRSKADVLAKCVGADASERLVDARPRPRWAGEAPEPRPGIRSGRVPGSSCVPFFDLLNEDKTYKSASDIVAVFKDAGVDLADASSPIVMSCGTGVTACVLALGAEIAGRSGIPVYDGSWTEWGAEQSGCPVDGKA